jgi:hypothetical protein
MTDAPVGLPIAAEPRDEPTVDEGEMHNTVVSFDHQVYKIQSSTVLTVSLSHLFARLLQVVV